MIEKIGGFFYMSKDYSREAAAAIHRFLKDDDWHFSFDEDEGTFKFGLNIESKLRKIDYLIRVHDTHYNVYAVSPLNAEKKDKDRRDNNRRDNDRRDNRNNRSGKPAGKQGGAREEFAPGTIGYILAHQKKR
jgi:hypothetical protein